MPFSKHAFHNSNTPLLQRFKANSSHPEHWCLTGKLTERSKSDYFYNFLQTKIKVAACYYFMIYLRQEIIWSTRIKDMISLIISSYMAIISSCPFSASTNFSVKKRPLTETHNLSLQQHSSLIFDAIQSIISKNIKCHNHHMKDYVLKTIQKSFFHQGWGSNSCFLQRGVSGQAAEGWNLRYSSLKVLWPTKYR